MPKIVIDTNVIVSAALSPKGIPAKIVDLISDFIMTPAEYLKTIADG